MSAPQEFPLTRRCLGGAPRLDGVPDWIHGFDNPYLHGVYAPTVREMQASALSVEGELPADLCGAYFRNGPNPLFPPAHRYHPFDGDGMVHAVYFRDGGAAYRNRYVATDALEREREAGRSLSPGVMGPFDYSVSRHGIKDTANTDLIGFADQLVALWYNAGDPCALDPLTLETRGPFDMAGRPRRQLSAHSKVDWRTGELIFFDYGDEPPYLSCGIANARGGLVREIPVELPGPRLPHDIGFTARHLIVHDLPLFHDLEVLRRHRVRALTFHRDLPARFGVLPRDGSAAPRWFECEPCYILHVTNCWEDGDWIVMDGCRSTNPMPAPQPGEGDLSSMLAYMRLEANAYRWRFNLATGEVREGDIDDLNTEFNKSNPLFHGAPSRYSYHQRIPLLEEGGHTLRFTGLVKYDNDSGRRWQWDYGPGVFGSEAVFAPRAGAKAGAAEDDGYVITLVTDTADWRSRCLVFDAADVAAGPIARVELPQRVPFGFHATWMRGADLYATAT